MDKRIKRQLAMANHHQLSWNLVPKHRSVLSMAIAAALAMPAIGQAQDNVEELEEIVVTGIRASIENSMEIKMESSSIVEAVTAEDIGKLPDISITESLARLPGLTAQRLNGRGQVISIRGLSPDFTNALLNGREQVSASDNRGVEFDQYPSELLSSAVVYKTPDAALIGQGLAGTVDMRTVSPLAYGKQTIAGQLRYEWTELDPLNAGSADDGWRYSLSYIDQFADDTLGIAIGYAHMSSPSQEERFNAWGYPQDGGNYVIGGAKPYVRSGELTRDGLIGVIEYEPTESFATAVDVYYSEFEEDQQLRGIEFPLYWSSAQLQPERVVSNGLITEGTFANVKGVMRNDINNREADVFSIGWKTSFRPGENWEYTLDLSHSKVDRKDTLLETYSGTGPAGQGATDTMGFKTGKKGTKFSSILDYTDPNLILLTSPQGWGGDVVPGGQLGYLNKPDTDDELNQIRLGAERDVDWGFVRRAEFGVNYAQRDKTKVADEYFLALSSGLNQGPLPPTIGVTDLSFLGIPGMISYNPMRPVKDGTYNLIRNPNGDVTIKSWKVEEDVATAYAMFTMEDDWGVPFTGNFGLQVVYTDQSSTAAAAEGTGAGGEVLKVSGGDDYTELLPSVNITLDIGNDQYFRIAAARTLARARMDDMRASQTWGFDASKADSTDINNSPWSANGGNPELKPWLADGLDLSYEKYFADRRGYFALAGFYKYLENYIYTQTVVQDFTGYPTGDITPAIYEGLATKPDNGDGGYIAGVEVSLSVTGDMFTPYLKGFGAILNASYTDSGIKPNGSVASPLPGLSEEIANVTLYYEDYGFSARVSGRYRSDFLGEVSGFGAGREFREVKGETLVDAQLGYTFDDGILRGLSFYLQGINLTDEPFITFQDPDERRVIDYQRYGRSYLLGVSYRYD